MSQTLRRKFAPKVRGHLTPFFPLHVVEPFPYMLTPYSVGFSMKGAMESRQQATQISPLSPPATAESLGVYQCENPSVRSGDSIMHKNAQTLAFCGWITSLLRKQDPGSSAVTDLSNTFTNGHQLVHIIFELTGSKVEGLVDTQSAYDKITNLNLAVDAFAAKFEGSGNVNTSAIASHNPKASLDCVWMFFYYSLLKPIQYCGLEDRFALLLWAQHSISSFPNTPVLHDFSQSFSDGLALCALVESKFPGVFDLRSMSPIHKADNLRKAFDAIEKNLGVPKLLSAIDVTSDEADEISMIVYLTLIYHSMKTL